ncbi:unnamed protein product [Sphagnum jensenii]|uniref:Uncharacterized protein n=1 Tax=Sphagnum jensenii TaxID=128206 RepID=A0ABP1BST7_9BRYO
MSIVESSSLTLRTLLLSTVEAHHPCTLMPFTCMEQQFLFPLKQIVDTHSFCSKLEAHEVCQRLWMLMWNIISLS